jgi:Tfp pilus assembly protein PilE
MIRKLKQNKGETLVESLIAVLIAVLAMGLVATATISAANINKSTREADAAYAEELEKAEIFVETTKETKKLRVKFNDNNAFLRINGNDYADVGVYGDGSTFASYK